MGLTHVDISVGNPANGRKREAVRCLVDSGAIYSLVPGRVLRRLGIKPHSTREFVLANGDVVRRRLATATFEYQGRRGDSMVIVGEPTTPCSGRRPSKASASCSTPSAASCARCSCP